MTPQAWKDLRSDLTLIAMGRIALGAEPIVNDLVTSCKVLPVPQLDLALTGNPTIVGLAK
jgi:hypothetical protein